MSRRIKQKGGICIVNYAPEEYTRYYIVQALFKLMNEYEFEKISVTDVARATFYRYFKRKEDVIVYYFEHNRKSFEYKQRFYERCREDYLKTITDVLTLFQKNKDPFKLIRRARLEYLYLDYLNKYFSLHFRENHSERGKYSPYLFAGMLFNVSMAWLDGDCTDPTSSIAQAMINVLFPTA